MKELGLSENISLKAVLYAQKAIMKIAPKDITQVVQGNNVRCKSLPPLWNKVFINKQKIYFSTVTQEFQADVPGVTADEIEQYRTYDVKKFLKCMGFQPKLIGRDIFDVFRKEKMVGKGLLRKTYKDLVALGVSEKEAERLRLTLAPLQTIEDFVEFDLDDTYIWVRALGVSEESLNSLRRHDVKGKKIADSVNMADFLEIINVKEGDGIKIRKAIEGLKYESNAKLGMATAEGAYNFAAQQFSPLNSLQFHLKSDYTPLAVALEEGQFMFVREMLDKAKEKWKLASEDSPLKRSGLTEEEAAAIYVYTYDFGKDNWEKNPFRVVNKTLAERNVSKLVRIGRYILHLLAALRKLPRCKEGTVLYRGMEGPGSPHLKEIGSELSWPAFTSTTTDENTVVKFIKSAREPIVFEIHGNFVGYDISPFSALGGEGEVLLEPETMFCVKEVSADKKFPRATRIVVEAHDSPLVIEGMVTAFNEEKSKQASAESGGGSSNSEDSNNENQNESTNEGKEVTQWVHADVVTDTKVCALDKTGQLPQYCVFKEAFERAGFGCTYEQLKEQLKKVTINKEKKLSDTNALTVFSYTMDDGGELQPYYVVNKALAERNANSLKVYPYIFHLLYALRKLPLYRGGKLYRGIDGELSSDKYEVEKTLIWPTFTSATYSKEKAYEFVMSDENINKKVVFEINGPVRGYSISDYSMFPDECEVLLEPETKFKVMSIGEDPKNAKITIISVDVIETPPAIYETVRMFMNTLPKGWTAFIHPRTGEMLYMNNVAMKAQREFPEEED